LPCAIAVMAHPAASPQFFRHDRRAPQPAVEGHLVVREHRAGRSKGGDDSEAGNVWRGVGELATLHTTSRVPLVRILTHTSH
jgi:hypothetical protein